ncbi:MAG: phosphotransferase, partial [Bacillota bacterium]
STVESYKQVSLTDNGGIINKITGKLTAGMTGLYAYDLDVRNESCGRRLQTILKLKSKNNCINDFGQILAYLSGIDKLPGLMEKHRGIFGFENSSIREIEIYNKADARIREYCPRIYGTMVDDEKEVCGILMERFSEESHSHTDTINRPYMWDDSSIKTVLDGMADIHSVYFNRTDELRLDNVTSNTGFEYLKARDLLSTITTYNASRFTGFMEDKLTVRCLDFLYDINNNIKSMKRFPSTLTHNDFNPRNICIKRDNGIRKLVVYDWELASIQNPQHDLAEFLVFALEEVKDRETVTRYIDYYIEKLEEMTAYSIDKELFYEVLRLNLLELAVVRFNLYLFAHGIMKFSFIDRAYKNLAALVEMI